MYGQIINKKKSVVTFIRAERKVESNSFHKYALFPTGDQ